MNGACGIPLCQKQFDSCIYLLRKRKPDSLGPARGSIAGCLWVADIELASGAGTSQNKVQNIHW